MRLPSHRESGQALMIGVLLFLALLMTIPAVIYLNNRGMRDSVKSNQKFKARAIADEGIAFAMQQLSQPNNWPYLGGQGTTTGLPAGGDVQSTQGNYFFSITYSSTSEIVNYASATLRSYQVGILSTPKDARGVKIPGSSVFAVVSRLTVGVKLPTGFGAGAALKLNAPPTPGEIFNVNWGPIVLTTADPWPVTDFPDSPTPNFDWDTLMDSQGYPRKFSTGPIGGTSRTRSPNPDSDLKTDQKEYWANTAVGFSPVVDLSSYTSQALMQNNFGTGFRPRLRDAGGTVGAEIMQPTSGTTPCLSGVPDCGYFIVPGVGNEAFFDHPTVRYLLPSNNSVLYIEGNAAFRNVFMDVSQRGAIIVTGNLTLDNKTLPSTALPNYVIPPTAPLEYPFHPPLTGTPIWPNRGFQGRLPPTPNSGHVHGFIYVGGDLRVLRNDATGDMDGFGQPFKVWTLSGTVMVEGNLRMINGGGLAVWYDDVVNHNIRTSNFDLVIDSLTAVP
jgi:hypothetical protein